MQKVTNDPVSEVKIVCQKEKGPPGYYVVKTIIFITSSLFILLVGTNLQFCLILIREKYYFIRTQLFKNNLFAFLYKISNFKVNKLDSYLF